MKKLFISLICCLLIYGNLYSQIPKEFHGTYNVKLDFPIQEIADQVYEALMDIPNNFSGITLYDNDLSIGNMQNSTQQGTVIRPSCVVISDDGDAKTLAQGIRKNSFQVVDKENNEIYDPDDMTLIIEANGFYKKNNNTGTTSLIYKLKEGDTISMIHNERSFYDGKNSYRIDLDKNERLYLSEDEDSDRKKNYISFGFIDGTLSITFVYGRIMYPYLLYPIKDPL